MANIFVFSASGAAAVVHYQRTMEQGIPIHDVFKIITDPDTRIALEQSGSRDKCYLWGDRGGSQGRMFWEQMAVDDLVLGYRGRRIISASYIVAKTESALLGRFAWPDSQSDPFRLQFFVTHPVKIDILTADYPQYFGKVYQGLRRLGQTERLLNDYGSLDAFVRCALLKTTELNGEESLRGDDTTFQPSEEDSREKVIRQIAARRGQSRFRSSLRERYGEKCLVTGCDTLHVLEAAHICPYRGPESNHSGNGLLLRSDVHTLFDLDLLGIDPLTMTVHIHPQLEGSEYDHLAGRALLIQGDSPSHDALEYRWRLYQQKQSA